MNLPRNIRSFFSSSRLEALLPALLVFIVICISWPGMSAPLLLDDKDQLLYVRNFASWKDSFGPDCYGLFRPLKNFIFYFYKDASVFHWHVFTLGGYLLAALAVYGLFRRIFGAPVWAFVGALLWAGCPTQVSTAVWMSAVNLSLAVLFSCGCLVAYDFWRTRPGRNVGWMLLVVSLLFLAQVSYETAIAVPAFCVLIDLFCKRPLFSWASFARYGILGGVTLFYLVLRTKVSSVTSVENLNFGFSPDLQAWQLSFSAPWFLWKHFSMWMVPLGRIEFCSTYIWGKSASMTELVAAWVFLLGLLVVAGWLWKRLPVVTIGILWFLAASFPPSNLIPIWSGPIEDYYLVFPGMGLAIILIGVAKWLWEWAQRPVLSAGQDKRLFVWVLLVSMVAWRLFLLPLFWLQADLWNRPAELYLRQVDTRPYQFQLQASAARELMLLGQPAAAKELALASYEAGPWYPVSTMLVGYISFEEGDLPTAAKYLGEVMQKTGAGSDIHDYSRYYLAFTFKNQGADLSLIRETLLPLLENGTGKYHRLAIELFVESSLEKGQFQNALRIARKAVDSHPGDPVYVKLLADIQAAHPDLEAPLSK